MVRQGYFRFKRLFFVLQWSLLLFLAVLPHLLYFQISFICRKQITAVSPDASVIGFPFYSISMMP